MLETYRTGRGGFRVRAKWETEDLGRGGYQIIVTQIPFQVQKSRLIEKIAELLVSRRLPLLEDCATRVPRTSGSCSCRKAGRSMRPC